MGSSSMYLPEPHDEIVDGASIDVFLNTPDVLKHCLSGHRFAFVFNQVAQNVRLHHGQG